MDEVRAWPHYTAKNGPLNPLARADARAAMLAHLMTVGHGIKKKNGESFDAMDFMPYGRKDEMVEKPTVNDLAKVFGIGG